MVSSQRSDRSRSRSLAPKEHGAYAQLGLPLATALISGRPGGRAFVLTFAAIAAFAAHEPLMVVLGRRGARAKKEHGRRALAYVVVLAICASSAAFALSTAMILPAVLFIATAALVAFDRERTTVGETTIAACLASAAIPVAVASAVPLHQAIGAWVAWSIGLYAATIAVRGVLAARKKGTPPARTAALVVLAPLAAAAAAAFRILPWWTVAASAPLVSLAFVIALRPPHPRALARVGWALVLATVATGLIIVLAT